jgi:hypothetical protein
VSAFEVDDIDDGGARVLDALTDEVSGLLSEEDLREAAEALENNSSAALLVLEHTWATRL